jgi:hypothetical membrane protein
MNRARLLLGCGAAVPFIYFANLFVFGRLTPGFDHASQMPSELGVASVPFAALFNAGLIVVGVALVLGAVGLAIGLRKIGAHWVLAELTSLSVGLAGYAMAMAGLIPLPDPLHYGFNVIVAAALTPLLGAFAVGAGYARVVLLAAFAAIVAINAVTIAVDGAMTPANVGWWVRGLGLVVFSAIAYLCWAVMRRI